MNSSFSPFERFKLQLISKLSKIYLSLESPEIVIWGTGAYGKWLLGFFQKIGINNKVSCFCDSFHDDCKTEFINSIPIYSPSKCYLLYPKAKYIIASDFYKEILSSIEKSAYSSIDTYVLDYDNKMLEKQLIYYTNPPDKQKVVGFNYTWFPIYENASKNCKLEEMLNYTDEILADQESKEIIHNRCNTFLTGDMSFVNCNKINRNCYFSNDFFNIDDDEVLFDCGAFIGDTVERFVTFTNRNYKKILAFEPDSKNIDLLKKYFKEKKIDNALAIQAATGNWNGKAVFINNGNINSKLVDSKDIPNSENVDIVKLDNYINYKPTLIKMDIEGAELNSLKGAQRIIETCKPKLAICIYHMPFDFYEIPKYIKSIVPEYKIKVRQHEPGFCETVMYAYL
ncbi:MAG: FkbM family methyltransferase [Aeromonadales bacterium]|nr:FkbM family methyltransferase [Aeromonadales bacterium]MDY2891287.1 FkbM family methyltransferase [Succinivibrio sp.]